MFRPPTPMLAPERRPSTLPDPPRHAAGRVPYGQSGIWTGSGRDLDGIWKGSPTPSGGPDGPAPKSISTSECPRPNVGKPDSVGVHTPGGTKMNDASLSPDERRLLKSLLE